jgi:hypothetical protein
MNNKSLGNDADNNLNQDNIQNTLEPIIAYSADIHFKQYIC